MISKKTMKIISILVIALTIIMSVSTVCFADISSPSDITAQTVDTTNLSKLGGQIITIIRSVGMVLSIIIIMILGIKYMMGSAEEKAEYKKTMIPYFIGALLLFGATFIATAIVQFASGIAA